MAQKKSAARSKPNKGAAKPPKGFDTRIAKHRKLTRKDVKKAANLFVAPALPITGAVGSPVNPLAIK